jgi:hypothetical protein
LGHSRVAQRTTPICAIVLLRTKAAFVSFIEVVEAANSAAVVLTVRCLGSAEFDGSLRLSSPNMIEASRRQSSIRKRLWNGCLWRQSGRLAKQRRQLLQRYMRVYHAAVPLDLGKPVV